MKFASRLIGLGFVFATCIFAAREQSHSENLQFSPKAGDRFRFKMTGKLHVVGNTAEIFADIDCNVTKVDNDRAFTMTSTQTNTFAIIDGQKLDLPDSSYTTVNKENGELVDFQTAEIDKTSWRMIVLKRFIYPPKRVRTGDEWSSSVTADINRGMVSAVSTFRMENLEKIGPRVTAKVKISFRENEGALPASSEGYTWIDVTDGSVVRTETTWQNAPTPQGPISGKIVIKRV